jgi:hypothetical protein
LRSDPCAAAGRDQHRHWWHRIRPTTVEQSALARRTDCRS